LETEQKAREWQRVILEVAAGRLSATEAAVQMGVSRKTYYEKQERALTAMLEALKDRPTGRPGNPVDPEREGLLEELEGARKAQELLSARLRIQEVMRKALLESGAHLPTSKKKRAM
jgi:hypothetical protein